VSRHRRLQVKIRHSPARQVRRLRNRWSRQLWRDLKVIARPQQPWADPGYTGVMADLRAAWKDGQ
jgi:hypothetical protein